MLPLLIIISAIILFPLNLTKNGRSTLGRIRVATILKLFSQKGSGYVVNNITSGKIDDNDDIVEFNHIFVSTSGIYLIRVVNQEGEIIGSDEDEEWTQKLKKDVVNKFPNPVKCANERVEAFLKSSNIDHDVYKYVVFSKGKVKNNSSSAITMRQLVNVLKSRKKIEAFTKEEIAGYVEFLEKYKENRINEYIANNNCYKCGAPLSCTKKKNHYIISCTNKKCGIKVKL